MSPRQEKARPIKRIKLKVTLEGDAPSLARARRALKEAKPTAEGLVIQLQTQDPAEAIQEIARVGKAVRETPKDFK